MELLSIIKEAADNTILKQDPTISHEDLKIQETKLLKHALKAILKEDNYSYFTSRNNARDNMRAIGKDALIMELIHGGLVNREIRLRYGKVIENEFSNLLENSSQAENYLYNRFTKVSSPSVIYNELLENTVLQDLLVDSYVSLVTTTEKERKKAIEALKSIYQVKLNDLEKLEEKLIISNQSHLIDESENHVK